MTKTRFCFLAVLLITVVACTPAPTPMPTITPTASATATLVPSVTPTASTTVDATVAPTRRAIATARPTPDYISKVQGQLKAIKSTGGMVNKLTVESAAPSTNSDYTKGKDASGSFFYTSEESRGMTIQYNAPIRNGTVGIVTQFENTAWSERPRSSTGLFVRSIPLNLEGTDFKQIKYQKYYNYFLKREVHTLTLQQFFGGKFTTSELNLGNITPNTQQLLYFPPGMDTVQLIELAADEKSGRVLAAVVLSEQRDNQGNPVFTDVKDADGNVALSAGVFTNGTQVYSGFGLDYHDRIAIRRFDVFSRQLNP